MDPIYVLREVESRDIVGIADPKAGVPEGQELVQVNGLRGWRRCRSVAQAALALATKQLVKSGDLDPENNVQFGKLVRATRIAMRFPWGHAEIDNPLFAVITNVARKGGGVNRGYSFKLNGSHHSFTAKIKETYLERVSN